MRDGLATVSLLFVGFGRPPKRKEGPRDLTHCGFHPGLAWPVLEVTGTVVKPELHRKMTLCRLLEGGALP